MSRVRAYAVTVLAVAAAAAATYVIYDWIQPSISLLFFPAVVVAAIYGGYGPAALATILSTMALAWFFVPPRYTFNFGVDDAVRLGVFGGVSFATVWLAAKRRLAEEGERRSIEELQATVETLRQVCDWPMSLTGDFDASCSRLLRHAAAILHADTAVAAWETDDEPWVFVAASDPAARVVKLGPDAAPPAAADALSDATFVTDDAHTEASAIVSRDGALSEWRGAAIRRTAAVADLAGRVVSSPFRSEHLTGRVFFAGIPDATSRTIPSAELVVRELGNSLDQLYAGERARHLAVRENRLQVSRDLHDGVLQALTGIRLEVQSIADDVASDSAMRARLSAIERALAAEQRELRVFIDDLKPAAGAAGRPSIASRIDAMCARLSREWRVPITADIVPADFALPRSTEEDIRLMVHEAIVNALKHGRPSRISVRMDGRGDRVDVAVRDDGRGFHFHGALDHDALSRMNVGPVSLRERVTALQGRLDVESSSAGSSVHFSFPVAAQVP